jgi:tetratricopeptide (TPR) repeat protein
MKMGRILRFPSDAPSKFGFQAVKATYTVPEISEQFGLHERYIRRWTREGLIQTASPSEAGELRYDFRALRQFRLVRELRGQGSTLKQIDAVLRGQLNLFPEPGQLIRLPVRLSPFEEALLLHERGDSRAAESYWKAIQDEDYVADAYCNLGILEFEGARVTKAFDCFANSLKHDPRHFESHFNLGNLYFESGDLRLSRLHYEMAAEVEPSFPHLYFNLGLVHATAGDLRAAIASLEQYKQLASEADGSKADDLLANLATAVASQG